MAHDGRQSRQSVGESDLVGALKKLSTSWHKAGGGLSRSGVGGSPMSIQGGWVVSNTPAVTLKTVCLDEEGLVSVEETLLPGTRMLTYADVC